MREGFTQGALLPDLIFRQGQVAREPSLVGIQSGSSAEGATQLPEAREPSGAGHEIDPASGLVLELEDKVIFTRLQDH
jgi:hypothetical protein